MFKILLAACISLPLLLQADEFDDKLESFFGRSSGHDRRVPLTQMLELYSSCETRYIIKGQLLDEIRTLQTKAREILHQLKGLQSSVGSDPCWDENQLLRQIQLGNEILDELEQIAIHRQLNY